MSSRCSVAAGALAAATLAMSLGGVAAAGAAAPAPVEPAAAAEPGATPAVPPWSLGMVGGMVLPTGAMKDSHDRGLVAGLRLAWTGKVGLGVEAAVDYSPLPHRAAVDGRWDTAYGTAAIGPRMAAGWSILRFAVAAGGGVAVDHTTFQGGLAPDAVTKTTIAPAAEVGLEVELRVVDGGGFMITGGGTHAFGDLGYQYAWAMGGLALSF